MIDWTKMDQERTGCTMSRFSKIHGFMSDINGNPIIFYKPVLIDNLRDDELPMISDMELTD